MLVPPAYNHGGFSRTWLALVPQTETELLVTMDHSLVRRWREILRSLSTWKIGNAANASGTLLLGCQLLLVGRAVLGLQVLLLCAACTVLERLP